MQVGTIDYSPYLGRLGIGKVVNGTMTINQPIAVARRDGSIKPVRITKIYRFERDRKVASRPGRHRRDRGGCRHG